ncbi:hypothetical protein F5144DRAFT_594938 [Chaetomium tenue]|uniref:Uncharacterized protein n=1 Tax=Chaetomium tenue TaxID=1854479 RepID=A0ACB7NWX8_9PEZI|nr:hypothetical protein F5144DRAFT_594938 [Chaetomium globosum]
MPNTGRCTASMTNPKHTQWAKANPGNKLNPHMKRVECGCNSFVAKNAAEPDKKCTCNHDNKNHVR